MAHTTTITIDGIVLVPVCCDWVSRLFDCRVQTRQPSTLEPLRQAMATGMVKTCHLRPSCDDSRRSMPLSFAAYVHEWTCLGRTAGLDTYAITLAMSGPPWREDDTPVESPEPWWDVMFSAAGAAKD